MTRTVPTILKVVGVNDQECVLIQTKVPSLFAAGFAPLAIVHDKAVLWVDNFKEIGKPPIKS